MAVGYLASYAARTPPGEVFETSLEEIAGAMLFEAPVDLDRRPRDVTPPRFAGGPARRKRLREAHQRSFACGASTSSAGQAALLPTEPFFADELGDGHAAPPAFSVREFDSLQGGVARRVVYDEREQPIEWPWEASQRATAPPQGALADGAPAPDVDHAAAHISPRPTRTETAGALTVQMLLCKQVWRPPRETAKAARAQQVFELGRSSISGVASPTYAP